MSDDQNITFEEVTKFLANEIDPLKQWTTSLEEAFAKLFIAMERRFDKIEVAMATKADIEKIYRLIDGLARQFDDEEIERTAIKNQLNRHERWHQKTAVRIGMKLG